MENGLDSTLSNISKQPLFIDVSEPQAPVAEVSLFKEVARNPALVMTRIIQDRYMSGLNPIGTVDEWADRIRQHGFVDSGNSPTLKALKAEGTRLGADDRIKPTVTFDLNDEVLNDLARIPTSSILRLGEDRAPRISFAQLRADGVTIGKEAEAILASIQNMNGVKLLLGLYAAGGSSDGLRRPVEQDPRDSSHWTHRKVMYQSSDGINVVLSMPKPVVDRLVLLLEGNSLVKPPQKR